MGVSFSATKLKVSLQTANQRMSMTINKKNNAIRVESRVIATLLQQAKDESARIKVEGILHSKNLVSVYETLQLMCELLTQRIQLISHCDPHCPPPSDLEESIATIIYCSSRVEIDELVTISQQFAAKFGEKWARTHVNNDSGKVNPRIVDKLRIIAPPFNVIIQLMQEIAGQYQVDWKPDLVVIESGIRDANPERLGSVAGGPPVEELKSSEPQYDACHIESLPSPTIVQQQSHISQSVQSLPLNNIAESHGPVSWPGTLNVILLQSRDLAASSDTNAEIIVRVTEPNTGLTWRSLPALPSQSPNTLVWQQQHCPIAISAPTVLVVVEAIARRGSGSEEIIGGLSIEAEQMRRSSGGTWYSIFSSHTHKPSGSLLLASQYLPLVHSNGGGSSVAASVGRSPSIVFPAGALSSPLPPPPYNATDIQPPSKPRADSEDGALTNVVHITPNDDREGAVTQSRSNHSHNNSATGADDLEARFRALG